MEDLLLEVTFNKNRFVMKKLLLSILVIFGLVMSCNTDDLNKLNPNELLVETYYKNAAELETGVVAIFGTLSSTRIFAREYWFLHDLRSDDNVTGGGQLETNRNQILIGAHDSGNGVANSVWQGIYQAVLRANIVINRGAETEDIDPAERDILIAEAKFVRGWAYYELGTVWGGAPIYTNFATTISENAPRSSQEETLAQAIADLQDAANTLPPASGAKNNGRPTTGAARALLARTYMFQGNYAAAKTELEAIVNSNEYSLVAEYDDNFQEENEYNSESIWEIGYTEVGGYNWNGEGDGIGNERSVRTQEYSPIGWRNLIPAPSLIEEFETPENGDEKRDPRLDKTIYFTGDLFNNGLDTLTADAQRGNAVTLSNGEEIKASWRKYSVMYKRNPGGFNLGGINHRVIRYAEVLLNLAESEMEVGNLDAAIDYLNQVRARPSVDMPPYPTANYPVSNADEVMAAIIHEKRVEHASEQIRNRDIIRWRKEGKLKVDPIDYFVPNKFELMPIPQSEIDNNPAIDESNQNPGY